MVGGAPVAVPPTDTRPTVSRRPVIYRPRGRHRPAHRFGIWSEGSGGRVVTSSGEWSIPVRGRQAVLLPTVRNLPPMAASGAAAVGEADASAYWTCGQERVERRGWEATTTRGAFLDIGGSHRCP